MNSSGVNRILFQRPVAERLEVTVADLSEGRLGTLFLSVISRPAAIVLNEGEDVHSGRQFQKVGLQAPESVLNLQRFRGHHTQLLTVSSGLDSLRSWPGWHAFSRLVCPVASLSGETVDPEPRQKP